MNQTLRRKSYSQQLRFMLIASIGPDKGQNCEKAECPTDEVSFLFLSLSLPQSIITNKSRLTELSRRFSLSWKEKSAVQAEVSRDGLQTDSRISLLLGCPEGGSASAIAEYIRVR